MRLTFRIIREDIIDCHSVEEIEQFEFVEGEERTIAIQLINKYNEEDYMLPTGWEAKIIMKTADPQTDIEKSLTPDSVNRSILTTSLSSSETEDAVSGPLRVEIFETASPTNKRIAVRNNIFEKTRYTSC